MRMHHMTAPWLLTSAVAARQQCHGMACCLHSFLQAHELMLVTANACVCELAQMLHWLCYATQPSGRQLGCVRISCSNYCLQ